MRINGAKDIVLAVGIATSGRPETLNETLRELSRQTRLPNVVYICPAEIADFDGSIHHSPLLEIVVIDGPRGLASQRNAILDAAKGVDILIFFDDDFFPDKNYLTEVAKCFLSNKDIVAASGHLIVDDIKGPGLDPSAARHLLAAYCAAVHNPGIVEQYNAYGCNMCIRLEPVYAHKLVFDEKLPLYGWLEDVDFCRRLSNYGRVVKCFRMVGVHLGVKSGRTSGLRFGYSQVANPIYIWQKGSTDFSWVLYHIGKNVFANISRFLRPEPWIDRRGRLIGNYLALRDLLKGKIHPGRILEIER